MPKVLYSKYQRVNFCLPGEAAKSIAFPAVIGDVITDAEVDHLLATASRPGEYTVIETDDEIESAEQPEADTLTGTPERSESLVGDPFLDIILAGGVATGSEEVKPAAKPASKPGPKPKSEKAGD